MLRVAACLPLLRIRSFSLVADPLRAEYPNLTMSSTGLEMTSERSRSNSDSSESSQKTLDAAASIDEDLLLQSEAEDLGVDGEATGKTGGKTASSTPKPKPSAASGSTPAPAKGASKKVPKSDAQVEVVEVEEEILEVEPEMDTLDGQNDPVTTASKEGGGRRKAAPVKAEPQALEHLRPGCTARHSDMPGTREGETADVEYRFAEYFREFVAAGFRCPDPTCPVHFVRKPRKKEVGMEIEWESGLALEKTRETDYNDKDSAIRHVESYHFVGAGRESIKLTCPEEGCGARYLHPSETELGRHYISAHPEIPDLMRKARCKHAIATMFARPLTTRGKFSKSAAETLRRIFIAREKVASEQGVFSITAGARKLYEKLSERLKGRIADERRRLGALLNDPKTLAQTTSHFWSQLVLKVPSEDDRATMNLLWRLDEVAADARQGCPIEEEPETSAKGKGTGKTSKAKPAKPKPKAAPPAKKPPPPKKPAPPTSTSESPSRSSPSKGSSWAKEAEEQSEAGSDLSEQEFHSLNFDSDEAEYETVTSKRPRSQSRGAERGRGGGGKKGGKRPRRNSPEPRATPMDQRRKEEEQRKAGTLEARAAQCRAEASKPQKPREGEHASRAKQRQPSSYDLAWEFSKGITRGQKKLIEGYTLQTKEADKHKNGKPTSAVVWFASNAGLLTDFLDCYRC